MKLKFGEYEAQSEKYYADMLEKFKEQARKMVTKKQRELDEVTKIKKQQDERFARLQKRVGERKIKNFWSDESEESEDEPAIDFLTRQIDLDEYDYIKKDRKRAKLAITKWVKKWRDEHNGENPTDLVTQPIAMELADYNHVNMQYLEIQMAMIKQDKMPFESEKFYNPSKAQSVRPNSRQTATKSAKFAKQSD